MGGRARVAIIGQRFGRLTIKEAAGTNGSDSLWFAGCDCGKSKIVSWRILRTSIAKGSEPSCGCNLREICLNNAERGATHRRVGTPEHAAWANMKYRCDNPDAQAFDDYGGRGIAYSPEWASFEAFFADMGERPTPEHSIHRVDNDLGYSKDNCKWALPLEQASNRRLPAHAPTSLLALDVAKKTGFAFGPSNEAPQTGSVQFGRGGSSMAATFAECRRWLKRFLENNPSIEMVVFESPLVPGMMRGKTNISTVRQLIGLVAVVEEFLFDTGGYDVREARVADIRTHFLGSNRHKRDMAKALTLTRCRQLGWHVSDTDAADAAALWHYQASILMGRDLFNRGK